ncbi:MAG: hypothetical protein K940chlam7_01145 [Chlamydiae bacterium]|nr:hypothetical protein [Chlamydiota bacterium]
MKKRLISIILGFFLLTFSLVTAEHCHNQSRIPFFGGARYDDIRRADIKESGHKGEHLKYSIGTAYLGSVVCYNPCREEGFTLSAAYTRTRLDWDENPEFDKSEYNTLSASISGFSNRLPDWEWKGNITFNIDTDSFDFEKYATWDLLLWGRYDYCNNLGLHIGFYSITGMKIDRVYPVIGFDWNCWRNLKINAVFPMDMSLIWVFNCKLETGAAVRFFESRHRVGKNENLSMALWTYRTYGAELFLNFNYSEYIHANVHIGESLGGKLKIADRHYGKAHHFRTKCAPYIGGEITLGY